MALRGIKVVEFAGLAPAPFCGMILADFGAKVIRIDKTQNSDLAPDTLSRGKRSIAVDLKSQQGLDIVKSLCKLADVLIEPFRPGVMEKLGLGPKILQTENPALVYARLSGYGQNGPYAKKAGHDLNYLAICGALSKLGRNGAKPTPPVNLLADFAGGGLMCAFGILAALFARSTSGKGQIVDASMVEGAAYVSSFLFTSKNVDVLWNGQRGDNLLDTGSPIYDTYETSDGKFVALACLEPQFLINFLSVANITIDPAHLTENRHIFKAQLTDTFKTKTRDQWSKIFDQVDACLTPVLDFDEAFSNQHNVERGTFIAGPDGPEPRPAPLLSSTPCPTPDTNRPLLGQHTAQILLELGYGDRDIKQLVDSGIVRLAYDRFNAKL